MAKGSHKSDLIRTFDALPANKVYFMAPKIIIMRGFQYYAKKRFVGLEWRGNTLVTHIRGTKLYQVSWKKQGSQVSPRCTCPYFYTENCKHIICSFVSLKNILHPQVFPPSPFSKSERRRYALHLKKSDLPGQDVESSIALVFSSTQNAFYCLQDKEIIALRALFPSFHRFDTFISKLELRCLKPRDLAKLGVDYVYDGEDGFIPLTLLKQAITQIMAQPVLENGKPHITFRLVRNGKEYPGYLIMQQFLILPSEKTLEILPLKKTLPIFIDDLALPKKAMVFPCSLALQRNFTVLREDLHLDLDNPKHIPPQYMLHIKPQGDEKIKLLFSQALNDQWTFSPVPIFSIFFALWSKRRRYAKNQKNIRLYLKGLLDILHQPNASSKRQCQKMLQKTLLPLSSPGMRQRFKEDLESDVFFLQSRERLLAYLNDQWILAPYDKVTWLKIVNEVFQNIPLKKIVDMDPPTRSITIRGMSLPEVLQLLWKQLHPLGVQFFVKNKPVRTTPWQVKIFAKSQVDWFSLHPEITLGKEVLSREELPRLFQSMDTGVMERERFYEIFPENFSRILQKLQKRIPPREEEVFAIPRLQILEWLSWRKEGVDVQLPPEDEKVLHQLLHFKGIRPYPLPSRFQGTLREYQKKAYEWLAFLYEHRFGAILADDMGLGKTIQTLVFLGGILERKIPGKGNPPFLIITPSSVLHVWEQEIQKFYPSFKVLTYIGPQRKLTIKGKNIILTTYAIARRDMEKLKKVSFGVIVLDEAQAIKNIHSQTAKALRKLQGKFRLALTGTPVENHLGEFYSIVDFALPGLLGDYDEFMRNLRQGSSAWFSHILHLVKPFLLRRTKEEVEKELPKKEEIHIYLDLTQKQKKLYNKMVQEIKEKVDKAYQEKTEARARIYALSALMKLRRLCLSPKLLSPQLSPDAPKLDFLIHRLSTLYEEGHCALIFSQFTSFLDLVEEQMKKAGLPYLRLDGSTPLQERERLVQTFQKSSKPLFFLLSLRAGGQGLTLTRGTYIFHLDPWWNPAVESQATDRAHRIGQDKPVVVNYLLMRHTVEEKMEVLKKKKRELYRAVLDGVKRKETALLTKEDIAYLLQQ